MTGETRRESSARAGSCFLGPALLAALLLACGGTVETLESEMDATGGVPFVTTGGALSTGGVEASGGLENTGGQAATGGTVYVEPQCPDEPPPPIEKECEPLAEETGCDGGRGCFPYLIYPNGEDCGDPQFGAVCAFGGSSRQGEPCADGRNSCAPGFMCILGASGGTRCAQICKPAADHMCPAGYVCGITDVRGYGVCY